MRLTPEQSFREWIAIPEARAWLESAEYAERCDELAAMLEEDEMTVQDAADFVGVPVQPFIWILSSLWASNFLTAKHTLRLN